ncbi:MAG: (2Fe-2S)-binding protein [Clostridia bacterium]|jgi:bacterioferritin-associated ferredoxin|nr:(2Fe-2S)-binding protein [Clostridia bacterium]
MSSEYKDRSADIGEFVPQPDDGLIICRCEEITKGDIRKAVHQGMWTMTEVKRFIRPGMGLCQGQTCSKHVKAIIAKELNVPVSSLDDITPRPPVRPAEMQVLGNEVESDE